LRSDLQRISPPCLKNEKKKILKKGIGLLTTCPNGAGKNWHENKKPFRLNAGLTSYEKRLEQRKTMAAIKEREKEMKDEKEAERQVRGGHSPHDDPAERNFPRLLTIP
jgi:hypothetical protein